MSSDQINAVSYALGELKSAVNALKDIMETSVTQQMQINDKMDKRMSKVELRQHWAAGASAAIGSILGAFVGIFGRH